MDGLIFPGGFGAALNLCDFAIKGADGDIHLEVNRIIKEMLEANKSFGFIKNGCRKNYYSIDNHAFLFSLELNFND